MLRRIFSQEFSSTGRFVGSLPDADELALERGLFWVQPPLL